MNQAEILRHDDFSVPDPFRPDYNGRGDVTDDGQFSYTWDAKDRLVAVQPDSPSAQSQKDVFTYDPENRRTHEDIFTWDAANQDWVVFSTLKFVYNGNQMVAELDGQNHLLQSYAWGPTGTLLSITDYSGGTVENYQVVTDGSGSVVELLDSSTGLVAASYQYDPWGNPVSATGPAAGVSPFRWQGEFYDASFGGYYMGAREGSARLHIFLSPDPSGEASDPNLYRMVGNDPINKADPAGLDPTALNCVVCHTPISNPDFYSFSDFSQSFLMPQIGIQQPAQTQEAPTGYFSLLDTFGGIGIANVPVSDLPAPLGLVTRVGAWPAQLIDGSINAQIDYSASRSRGDGRFVSATSAFGKNTPVVNIGYRAGESVVGYRVGGLDDGQPISGGQRAMDIGAAVLVVGLSRLSVAARNASTTPGMSVLGPRIGSSIEAAADAESSATAAETGSIAARQARVAARSLDDLIDRQLRADALRIWRQFPEPYARNGTTVATGMFNGQRVYAVSSNKTYPAVREMADKLGYARVSGKIFTAANQTDAEQILLNYASRNGFLAPDAGAVIAPSRIPCGLGSNIRQNCWGRIANTPGVRLIGPWVDN